MAGHHQSIHIGSHAIERLPEILQSFSPQRVFVVSGKASFEHSGAKKALDHLLDSHRVTRFSDFSPNPKLEDIVRGIEAFRTTQPDIVIAIGGGSVIDTAKTINALSHHTAPWEPYIIGQTPLSSPGVPLIAIPTTAGAGSEATHFAVVYIDHVKHSLAHASMLPQVAIIDPTLTYSLPPDITASTGTDALCQAIESLWSVHSTQESMRSAQRSLDLCVQSLWTTVHQPTPESRHAMSVAALNAGQAINISKTTACHALSYPLTSRFGISHGQAVILTLPGILRHNYSVSKDTLNDPRGEAYVRQAIETVFSAFQVTSIEEAEHRLNTYITSLGLASRLSDLGITKDHIDGILSEASIERMKNNPRTLSALEAKQLFLSLL